MTVRYDILGAESVTLGDTVEVEIIDGNQFIYRTGFLDESDNIIIDTLVLKTGQIEYQGLDWKLLETFSVNQYPESRFELYRNVCGHDCDQKLIVAEGIGYVGRHGLHSWNWEILSYLNGVAFNDSTKRTLLKKLDVQPYE